MTTVEPRRAEAIRVGYEALAARLSAHGVSFDAFAHALEAWEVRAFVRDDRVVGMLMTKGRELHVAVHPSVRGRWLSRRLVREVFGPILEAHGDWAAPVAAGNVVGADFVRRVRNGLESGRFDPVTAAIGGGAMLGGGLLQAGAAQSAASTQADAARRGQDIASGQFQLINEQAAPYRQAGYNALNTISDMGGFFNKQFSRDDLFTNLAPNYEFIKGQGIGATQNFATMGGGLFSGNTLKAISDYTTNYAQSSYQQAFQNFTANQSNIFNRLASIAGLGQTSNQTVAQTGATLAGTQAEAAMAGGAARAGGIVGGANAITGGLNNAMSWYALPQILNFGGGGPPGGMDPMTGVPMS